MEGLRKELDGVRGEAEGWKQRHGEEVAGRAGDAEKHGKEADALRARVGELEGGLKDAEGRAAEAAAGAGREREERERREGELEGAKKVRERGWGSYCRRVVARGSVRR